MKDSNSVGNPRLFADIIGYVGEVSEPNGPRIVGYFLDDWADQAQEKFEDWLIRYNAMVRYEVLNDVADQYPTCKDSRFGCTLPLHQSRRTASKCSTYLRDR